MITNKDEHSIRKNFPVPEDMRSPLELLISKEEANVAFEGSKKEKKAGGTPGCKGLDVELLIFLADFAAKWPEKWLTVKERINDGRSTHEELAMRLRTSPKTIQRHLKDLRTEAQKWNKGPMVNYEAKSA